MKWLLVAHDKGPIQTLSPLIEFDAFRFVDLPNEINTIDLWKEKLSKSDVIGVVVSTSKSKVGSILETYCCFAAKELGLLVVVIEDYPFNFNKNNHGLVDLLIVESDYVKNEYLCSNQLIGTKIETGALIRYKDLRFKVYQSQDFSKKRRTDRILWLGQPETDNSLASLERIMPAIKSIGLRLDFRAHPDDSGYFFDKSYANLFINYKDCLEDVSILTIDDCLKRRPFLSLTQFSSLAIELGYRGLPSLHLLYEDLGGAFLFGKTGRISPVICEIGVSPVITKIGDELCILNRLKSKHFRDELIKSFGNYYLNCDNVPNVINKINSLN